MNKEKKDCTFTWLIENYSYCLHKTTEDIFSPEFTADSLDGTIWKLHLYPRGRLDEHKKYISLYLGRNSVDNGPENFPLKFELSILATDGSTLKCKEFECKFKKGNAYGNPAFLQLDESIMNDYVPHDTLTVQCKIWRGERNIQQIKQITARTRIGIKQISFPHVTESFSLLEPNQKKTIDIGSFSKNAFGLTCSLHFMGYQGQIIVEILPYYRHKILSTCKISLLDRSGKLIQCGEADNRFNTTGKDIQKLSLTHTRQVILKRKNEYLPDDKLTLLCKCIFSLGVEFENIETILHEIPIVALNQINDNDQTKGFYNVTEKLNIYPNIVDDLKEMYSKKLLTDMELKTTSKSFPVHKFVLCARSSVFQAMLTNDMRETNTNCIRIDDLEDDTVQQFLLFLYSDLLENLHWESAMKLYYASDKYAIEKLKMMCASFLLDNLSASTASELLLLADTHSDSNLQKAVEDFIFKHEEEVFGSEEWGNLIETNSLLVSKTMCLKYKR